MKIRPNSKVVPVIPADASYSDVFDAFKEGLTVSGRVSVKYETGVISIIAHNSNGIDDVYDIPSCFMNKNNRWPRFLYCTRHIDPNAPIELLSHWELLFIFLKERFDYAINREEIYGSYIRRDIANISRYVTYTNNCAYNAELKNSNVVVLLDVYWKRKDKSFVFKSDDRPIGDLFESGNLTSLDKEVVMKNAEFFNVYPGSESMLSESNKIIVANGNSSIPTATGFGLINNGDGDVIGFNTIFPIGSSLPARLKTHLNGDAFGLVKPDDAIFIQDIINAEEYLKGAAPITKDNTFLNAIVVYDKIDFPTYRMVAGDIEVSPRIGNQVVMMNRHIEMSFDGRESLEVEEGKFYHSKNGMIKIGTSDDEPVLIRNVHKIFVKEIAETGYSTSIRIDYVAYYKTGNARITSHSGFKGVTKVMSTCGFIEFNDMNGDTQSVDVDLIAGINSIKAKENSIRLAQAAFAVHYGFYKPKNGKLLDSLDEKEINMAAQSIPKVSYRIYREGKLIERQTKLYGLVQISYTEIGSHFAKIRDQRFSFNAGRYIHQSKDSKLGEYILNNCIDMEDKNSVIELSKCIYDPNITFSELDDLPIYSLASLPKIFNENDLILNYSSLLPCSSKLLDPEFNKGFYISLKAQRPGKFMRVPPAEVLNRFCGKQTDGKYVYPGLLIEISKTIDAAIKGKSAYYRIIPNANENNQNRPSCYRNYMLALQAMLYKTELGGQTLISTLIVPRLKGINLKQVHDRYVPNGVIVILDKELYQHIQSYVYKVEEEDDFASAITKTLKPVSCFTFRSPFLWRNQVIISELWDEERFESHLQSNYGFSLSDYLDKKANRFCVLINTDIVKCSHSDGDGDLLQITTLPGEECQEMMKNFELVGVSDRMNQWDKDFLKDEYSSIEKLDWKKPYKVYRCHVHSSRSADNSYMDLLTNSAIAKQTTGPATNAAWCFDMIVETYLGLYKDHSPDALIQFGDKKRRIRMSDDLAHSLGHIYTETVERYVINAIKHIIGGSRRHEIFMLDNIARNDKRNEDVVRTINQEMGYDRTEAITILQLVYWAKQAGLLENVNAFLRLYNKGQLYNTKGKRIELKNEDTFKWFSLLVKYSYFGSMLSPIFNIYNIANGINTESNIVDMNEGMAAGSNSSPDSAQNDSDFDMI